MTYPRRHYGFATHKECSHFSNGFCTLNGVMISPNQPACPYFKPKGITVTPKTEKPYQQPRKLLQVPLLYRRVFPVPPNDPENVYTTAQHLMPQHGYSSFQRGGFYSMSSGRAGGGAGGGGGGRGRGRGGGRGRGRMGGFGAGAGGSCVCPNCGYTEPHRLGAPCFQQKCPKCGIPMTRTR